MNMDERMDFVSHSCWLFPICWIQLGNKHRKMEDSWFTIFILAVSIMFHLKKVHQPWWSGGLITTNSNGSQLNSQFQHSRLVKHPYLMAIRHWNSIFDVFCTYLLVLVAPPLFVPFNVGSWQVTGGNELAKYWPPLNFSGSTFNGQLSYYSFISLRVYIFT